jgi:threonine synthase
MNKAEFFNAGIRTRYTTSLARWKGDQNELLSIDFEAKFFPDEYKKRATGIWRYREALPIDNDSSILSFHEGLTPLISFELPEGKIKLKLDYLFPSGSYKDRGASVMLSKIKEWGIRSIVQDSSGNAGCAVACYAALGKINCEIFVPDSTSPAKLAQIKMYGASLTLVPGTREDTAKAAMKRAESLHYASHCYNPFFYQGTKTFLYEVWEQNGFDLPEVLVLPAGNGTLVLGVSIAMKELMRSGLITKVSKIIAVQAENCSPLYCATNGISKSVWQDTLAEGIAIAEPVRASEIIDAVKESNGEFITVTETEIKNSFLNACSNGIYPELTSSACLAGASKYLQNNSGVKSLCTLISGNGLKSTEKILKLFLDTQ